MNPFPKTLWLKLIWAFNSLGQRWNRIRRLQSVMDLSYALKVVWRRSRDRSEITVLLNSINRRVIIRANTSDLPCLEKVFVEEEYRLPDYNNSEFAIRPKLIIDAGANVGMTSLYFAHTFPDATIIAIEPESSNFELLSRNCAAIPNIILKKAALWPSEAKLQIRDENTDKWMFSVEPGKGSGSIDTVTIPGILEATKLGHIDLLKIDIEGAERELFEAGAERWLTCVNMIVIELHDRYKDGCSQAFYSAISQRGFIQEICGENIFVLLRKRP